MKITNNRWCRCCDRRTEQIYYRDAEMPTRSYWQCCDCASEWIAFPPTQPQPANFDTEKEEE